MASAEIQSFETTTTFEVKSLITETEEEVVMQQETAPVIEMRNKAQPVNHVENAIRSHFGERVVDLIYWKDIKKSAVVAASSLFLLISLSIFSVLSVVSYISLAVLTATFSYAVYKRTLAAVQKSNEGHPFGQYLEMDLTISPEKAQEYAEIISSYMATYVGELRRLVLVEDMIDSIKFGIFLWVMTYIGAWFNGLTLMILGLVSMFSLPKTYEVYQEQIDAYLALAQDQVKGVMAQIHAKIPIGKKDQ